MLKDLLFVLVLLFSTAYSVIVEIPKINLKNQSLTTKYGVLFSWNVLGSKKNSKVEDHRFLKSNMIGKGNEFHVAVKSIYETHPDLPIFLLTNAEYINNETLSMIDTVHYVDLMEEGGFKELYKSSGDLKLGFGTKPFSIIYGWNHGIIPDNVLFLDVDTVIVEPTAQFNLHSFFKPLQYYDIAGVMEGYPATNIAVGSGWEINTGGFSVRKSAIALLEKWVQVFKEKQDLFIEMETGEQQALMVALQESPKFRMFPLPNVFNFRLPSIYARMGPQTPVVMGRSGYFHSHSSDDLVSVRKTQKQLVRVILEDIVNDVERELGGSVDCDQFIGNSTTVIPKYINVLHPSNKAVVKG